MWTGWSYKTKAARFSWPKATTGFPRGVPVGFQYWWCGTSQRPCTRTRNHWSEVWIKQYTVKQYSFHNEVLFFPLWLRGYKGGGLIQGKGEMSRIGVDDVKFTKRIKRFKFFWKYKWVYWQKEKKGKLQTWVKFWGKYLSTKILMVNFPNMQKLFWKKKKKTKKQQTKMAKHIFSIQDTEKSF